MKIPHQGGINFKPELRVRNQDYGGLKVELYVVEKREIPKSYNDSHLCKICLLFWLFSNFKIFLLETQIRAQM